MKKLFAIILLVMTCATARTAEQVEVFLTILETPHTGTNITINGVTRTFTNAHSSTTILTNLVAIGINNSATNLYFNLSAYTLSAPQPVIQHIATNKLRFVFAVGYPGVITTIGSWASVTNFTNTITSGLTVRVPKSIESASNRVHIGSRLIEYAEESTNYFKPGWTAATYLVGTTNAQVISGVKQLIDPGLLRPLLTNVVWLSGVIGRTTNGYWTNAVLDSPITTNLVNRGNAISSPGAGTGSEQFGTGAQANGLNSFAAGNTAIADGINSFAAGKDAYNGGDSSVAVGTGVEIPAGVGATNVTVYGNSSSAGAPNSGAFGSFVTVSQYHTNSFGMGESTTETNQTMLWGSTQKIRIPGQLQVTGSMTNNFLTGSNRVAGSWSLTRRTDSSQPIGFNIITNSASDSLVWLTAPAGTCTNVGFTEGYDGRIIRYIKYNGGYPMGIANQSGLASAERQVLTGTGADVTITNSPGWFDLQYDATLSRWILLGHSN